MKMRLFAVLFVLFAATACAQGGDYYKNITAEQAQEALSAGKVVVLDIRTPAEFVESHIKGGINIDFYSPQFKASLGELNRDTTYLVYCRSGNRSGKAMAAFGELGFKNILHLKNGFADWVGRSMPIVR